MFFEEHFNPDFSLTDLSTVCLSLLILQPEDNIKEDFLFPMSTRLSYASSPESDVDNYGDGLYDEDDQNVPPVPSKRKLLRSSSDPSLSTQDQIAGIPPYPSPPSYYRPVSDAAYMSSLNC